MLAYLFGNKVTFLGQNVVAYPSHGHDNMTLALILTIIKSEQFDVFHFPFKHSEQAAVIMTQCSPYFSIEIKYTLVCIYGKTVFVRPLQVCNDL